MSQKKYASLATLQNFLDNLKILFATKTEVDEKSKVQIVTTSETGSQTEDVSTLKIHKLSKEQYEEELANGTIDSNAIYLTPDEEIDLTPYATIEQLNTKADTEHTHEIDDVNNLQTALNELLDESKDYTDNAVSNKADVSHNHDSSYDAHGAAESALESAKSYTDSAVTAVKNDLLNGAGGAYDPLKELGDLINENTDAIEALEIIASSKADASHTHDDLYYTKTEVDNLELITTDDIDAICGQTIQVATASEVTF